MHTLTSKFTNRETKQRHTAVNYSTVIRQKIEAFQRDAIFILRGTISLKWQLLFSTTKLYNRHNGFLSLFVVMYRLRCFN